MRRPFIISCVALVVLAALNLWMWRRFTQERENAAALHATLAGMNGARPARHSPPEHPAIDRLEVALDTTAPADTPAVKPGAATGGNDLVRAWQERERQLLRDPEYRNSRRDAARQQFAQTRADAIRVVGMSPAQADRVIDLWVERNLWFAENGDVAGTSSMSDDARAELQRRSDAEQAEIRELLGAEKYSAWQHYLMTGSERAEVNQLNSRLAAESAQMAPELADRLVESFYREFERGRRDYSDYRTALGATDVYANPSRDDRQKYLALMRAANGRVHDAMAGSLSTVQLGKLDAMLAAKLVPIEAQLRLDGQ